jgi:hypothetical protein
VDAFAALEDVPVGYWPIIIRDDIHRRAAGIHEDKSGQPFALVRSGDTWSITASHENLEMLVDPFGKRLVAGQSPMGGQGRVEFLVEVCDPSEAGQFSYTVNGVAVSDFYTPNYFDPEFNSSVRYSLTGAISKPREVLSGGYLSWHDPVTDHWFQEVFFGEQPEFKDLGQLTANASQNFRRLICDVTPQAFEVRRPAEEKLSALTAMSESVGVSADSKARAWREQISEILSMK